VWNKEPHAGTQTARRANAGPICSSRGLRVGTRSVRRQTA
jgi:hypothetical protein